MSKPRKQYSMCRFHIFCREFVSFLIHTPQSSPISAILSQNDKNGWNIKLVMFCSLFVSLCINVNYSLQFKAFYPVYSLVELTSDCIPLSSFRNSLIWSQYIISHIRLVVNTYIEKFKSLCFWCVMFKLWYIFTSNICL